LLKCFTLFCGYTQIEDLENYNLIIQALGRIKNSEAIELLAQVLKKADLSLRIQERLIRQLAIPDSLAAGVHLLEFFWNSCPSQLFKDILDALEKIGNVIADPVFDMLDSIEEDEIRSALVLLLVRFGDNRVANLLPEFLTHSEPSIRQQAVLSLRCLHSTQAIGLLTQSLDDTSSAVRSRAAEALGELGDSRAVLPLLSHLAHNEDYVQSSIIDALGELGDVKVVPYLLPYLQHPAWVVRCSVAHTLGKLGDGQAVKLLIACLRDESRTVRNAIVIALGMVGDASAVQPLLEALKVETGDDEHSAIGRGLIAEALGSIGNEQVIQPLMNLLEVHEYEYVRQCSAYGLILLGNRLKLNLFEEGLKLKDRFTRLEIIHSLDRFFPDTGESQYLAALESIYNNAERWDLDERLAAAVALAIHNYQGEDY
jgi:HEAT repeat protein